MISGWRSVLIVCGAIALLLGCILLPPVRRTFHPIYLMVTGKSSVEDRLFEYSNARKRIGSSVIDAGLEYPPNKAVLLGLKIEKRLEVYAADISGRMKFIKAFPIEAASGELGPKLREGDRQVPEGIYSVDSLNPNSKFHLAIRVGYPNIFDREKAKHDGRTNLGDSIMIHGGNASAGCLAMGDPAIEEIFSLVADTGIGNTTILIAPTDLRRNPLPPQLARGWQAELYEQISREISRLPMQK